MNGPAARSRSSGSGPASSGHCSAMTFPPARLPPWPGRADLGAAPRRGAAGLFIPQDPGGADMPATHEVTNQVPALEDYDTADDPALLEALTRAGAGWAAGVLRAAGALAGSARAGEWARPANEHHPGLRTHDRVGDRVDEGRFH